MTVEEWPSASGRRSIDPPLCLGPFGWSNGGTRTTIRWPAVCGRTADRTLMVEPDSAEPIWKTCAAFQRAPVEPPVAVVERRWRKARRVLALTEASTRWRRSCSAGRSQSRSGRPQPGAGSAAKPQHGHRLGPSR